MSASPQGHRRLALTSIAFALIVVCAPAPEARAARGDCGQPLSDGEIPSSGDCMTLLRVTVGLETCDPPCICDVNATGTVNAADALLCLKKAVGQPIELTCLCPTDSTTTTGGPATTSTTQSSTTTQPQSTTTSHPVTTSTEPPVTTTLPSVQCPIRLDLAFLSGIRGACTSNADCTAGACDPVLSRCVTATELDLGWTGQAHDVDINDSVRLLTSLDCPGSAPNCGQCTVGGILSEAFNCRCADNNRRVCDEPFEVDANDCDGASCECYFGPPLPLSVGSQPVCFVNRLFDDISGSVDPDTGELTLDLELRSLIYSGETLTAPCPACGGRCLAPEAKLDTPCLRDSDCDTEEEAGSCGRFDEVAGDGERTGLCVGGPSQGFGCDLHGSNTSFPAPGGAGYSLDCLPESGKNISGQGLAIRLHQTTGPQSLASGVACGFPPVSPQLCPCGVCGTSLSLPCASNADCVAPATCAAPPGTGMPNACDDGSCTEGQNGEAACTTGPVDRFCDAILRANGRGILGCQSNADCSEQVIGIAAGACTLEETRECFPSTVSASGLADPQSPVAAGVVCAPPISNPATNGAVGLPGATRLHTQISMTAFCNTLLSSPYSPAQGCE